MVGSIQLLYFCFAAQLMVVPVHEFYVSICYIKFNNDHIEVRHRIFHDDFQEALQDFTGDPSYQLTSPWSGKDSLLIDRYLSAFSQLKLNGQMVPTTLAGITIEGEGPTKTVGCILYGKLPASDCEELEFQNKILMNQFDDQINMVHVIKGPVRKSRNLDHRISSLRIRLS